MSTKKYTILGYGAVIIWGMSAAVTRTLGESLGAFTSAALVNTIAGICAITYQIVHGGGLKGLKKAHLGYWIWCGPLYITFILTSYFSVTMAENREQVLIIVLIKLLWPLMTLLLTIPILKAKASPWIIGSTVVSLAGIVIANMGGNIKDIPSFLSSLSGSLIPYLMSFASAIAWGLYSNLTRKFNGNSDTDGVGIFMLIIGLITGIGSLTINEPRMFQSAMIGQVLYQSIVTLFIATILWNTAMRKGNVVTVAIASNLSPIIATVSTGLILGVAITIPVIIGTILLVAGTAWSKRCFTSSGTTAVNTKSRKSVAA